MARFKDFDRAIKERQSKANVSFRWAGETYVLPADLPAAIPIMVLRMHSEGGDEADMQYGQVLTALEVLIGKDQFDKLLATGISTEDLEEVFRWVLSQYTDPTSDADGDEGNAVAPA